MSDNPKTPSATSSSAVQTASAKPSSPAAPSSSVTPTVSVKSSSPTVPSSPVTPTVSVKPSISAVVATYEAEEFIAQALDSILGQTRPPDEVIVVDDGSTDGTARILDGYGDRIRVISQENRGYPMAMNRAIQEAGGEFVAPCGADDVWEPRKLEWQEQALAAHPEVGVLFGHAVFFGVIESDHVRPTGSGLLDRQTLAEDLFRTNPINMPSALIRRELLGRLGWFTDGFLADDFEFFFRCLRADVGFYYESRTLVRYRRHEHNITNNIPELLEAWYLVRASNADRIADRRLVAKTLSRDLFLIGRAHVNEGHLVQARRAIRRSLRHVRGNTVYTYVRSLAWVAILSLPLSANEQGVRALLGFRHAIHGS
jgi:glycosyltransferase involved in cell wall biosynthesis